MLFSFATRPNDSITGVSGSSPNDVFNAIVSCWEKFFLENSDISIPVGITSIGFVTPYSSKKCFAFSVGATTVVALLQKSLLNSFAIAGVTI